LFQKMCSPATHPKIPQDPKDATPTSLKKTYKKGYTSPFLFLTTNVQHILKILATPPSRDLTFPSNSMHYSVISVFASLVLVAQGVVLIPRQSASCSSYRNQACETGGEQHCCRTEGQPGTFATCDTDGELFYFASCDSSSDGTATCSQSSTISIQCEG
jgi:hypothetical protein